jgi:cytochrome c553
MSCVLFIKIAGADNSIMVNGGGNSAAMPCVACHGPDGKGMAETGFPRLSGLPADYIAKQLHNFKAGTREHDLMKPIATALSEDEILTVAKDYSAMPKINVVAVQSDRPKQGTPAWLALRGAWERNIPECISCHGPSGLGVGSTFPPLAGQSAIYLEAQLQAWKGKPVEVTEKPHSRKKTKIITTRHNDPNGMMKHIAADLSDDEIKGIAAYFADIKTTDEPFDETQHRLR